VSSIISQKGRAVSASVPVANSVTEAINAAAAVKVSALTALSVTAVLKLAVAVTASDPVALSTIDEVKIYAAVIASDPVADSCTLPKNVKLDPDSSVIVELSVTTAA
jgi:hypothetical protein